MCFYADYDWRASVCEESELVASEPVKCDECGRKINPGECYRHIYMQEHEACVRCDPDARVMWDREDDLEEKDRWDGESELPPCPEGDCDVGETFDYSCCKDCQKILAAIKEVELAEGCSVSESQPSLGGVFTKM